MASETKVLSKLDEFQRLVKNFEAVQTQYRRCGAEDTEPDGVFQVIIVRAFKGEPTAIPTTSQGWQLYSMKRASPTAARRLADAALLCTQYLSSVELTRQEAQEFESYLRDYAWRVEW